VSEQVTELTTIRKRVVVEAAVATAFRVFTDEIGAWWPVETHSVSRERAETAVLEGWVGGRLFERTVDGEEILWGEVTIWEPPHRLSYTWHPGRDRETGQEVEMRFVAEGERTSIELEHRGWERLPEKANEAIASYETGWDFVLGERYAATAEARG
jgi:uncharacterized protein YndB with AHSA1/START domain